MPKTAPAALLNVIRREVPTVALFLKVERITGEQHFFTSHDADLEVDGDTYLASDAFTRSAIEASDDLSVNDMQIIGFFNDAEVSNDDIAKSLLDGARVELFLADRDDPAKGTMSIFSGLFGEASSYDDGHFVIELRDFSQLLKTVVGAFYQSTCRSDLGAPFEAARPVETGCCFPVEPPVREDSTAYAVGDFIRVATSSGQLVFDAGLVNGGFEAQGAINSFNNSTTVVTGWEVLDSDGVRLLGPGQIPNISPHTGDVFLSGTSEFPAAVRTIRQLVDLQVLPDFNTVNVDAGEVDAVFSIYRNFPAAATSTERSRIALEALSGADAVLATLFDSGFIIGPDDVWQQNKFDGALPTGTRKVRVVLQWNSPGAALRQDPSFDSTSMLIRDRGQSSNTSFRYEDRIYECTTAGTSDASAPIYDIAVGNTTTDGSAVFTAREAFTFAAFVEVSGEDGRTFTVDSDTFADAKFAGAFFDFGALVWETGLNAGHTSQVKNTTVPNFELLLQTPFAIQPSDAFRVSAGCDKTRAACRDKFRIDGSRDFPVGNAVNFRGEPDLPGKDVVFRTPDAR